MHTKQKNYERFTAPWRPCSAVVTLLLYSTAAVAQLPRS